MKTKYLSFQHHQQLLIENMIPASSHRYYKNTVDELVDDDVKTPEGVVIQLSKRKRHLIIPCNIARDHSDPTQKSRIKETTGS